MSERFYVTQHSGSCESICITRVEAGYAVIIAEVEARPACKFSTRELAEKLRTLLNVDKQA